MPSKTWNRHPYRNNWCFLFRYKITDPSLYSHSLSFNVHFQLCPNILVVKYIVQINVNMPRVEMCDLNTPHQLSLQNEAFSHLLHSRHCVSKLAHKSIFASLHQFNIIIILIYKYSRESLSSCMDRLIQNNWSFIFSLIIPQPSNKGLYNSVGSRF